MSFLGNNNGFNDSKIFRKNVLEQVNIRLGVVLKTLSEGNGTQTSKTIGLLGLLDSNYKSDVPSTKYAMHLKAIAFESARFLCSGNDYADDLYFKKTKGEFLYQNIGSFLFPGEQIPQIHDTDLQVQNFYLSIIEAYFGGATKENIQKALYNFTGVPVTLSENFELSKTNESLDSVRNQFVFNVNVDTTDPRIKDATKLKSDIKFLLDLIKPAHTTYQTNFIYHEELLAKDSVQESITFDIFDYKYEDLRKRSSSLYSFKVDNEIIQKNSVIDNSFQASPRIVKTKDLSLQKESDPSVFHTRYGPFGKEDGNLADQLSDISVLVNGIPVDIIAIYPLSGSFKLPFVPNDTDTILATYYSLMHYTGELITNDYDSIINNLGNSAEFPYKTVLFPNSYSVTQDKNPKITSYRYKGYDLFNSSILNDPLSLNFNENNTRNKLNDYQVFKSLGYDQGKYLTSLQENISLVPMSLDKKDIWRRLPNQEFLLDDNSYIMNNIEDRIFGEIHEKSYFNFYSALELDSIDNGGDVGLISSILEDPINPISLSFSPFSESKNLSLKKDQSRGIHTYSPFMPESEASLISDLDSVLLCGTTWDFNDGFHNNNLPSLGGEYGSANLLVQEILNEETKTTEEELFPKYMGDSDKQVYNISEKIREFYKNDNFFILNQSLSNSDLDKIVSFSKLSESENIRNDTFLENTAPFILNSTSVISEVFSICSDLGGNWIRFLSPKKLTNVTRVFNANTNENFDLTDMTILNNQVICIKNSGLNNNIFSSVDIIKAEMDLFDIMNETDHLVSAFGTGYVFYSDIDITAVSRITNYSITPQGHNYNLNGYYILGNSLIYLDNHLQTEPLNEGDIVFAEFVTKEEDSNPANTLTFPRNNKILKKIEIIPL